MAEIDLDELAERGVVYNHDWVGISSAERDELVRLAKIGRRVEQRLDGYALFGVPTGEEPGDLAEGLVYSRLLGIARGWEPAPNYLRLPHAFLPSENPTLCIHCGQTSEKPWHVE